MTPGLASQCKNYGETPAVCKRRPSGVVRVGESRGDNIASLWKKPFKVGELRFLRTKLDMATIAFPHRFLVGSARTQVQRPAAGRAMVCKENMGQFLNLAYSFS